MTDTQLRYLVRPRDGVLIGLVRFENTCNGRGWRFVPMTTSRRPSRKLWPTIADAIPRWAYNLAEARYAHADDILLTRAQWLRRRDLKEMTP